MTTTKQNTSISARKTMQENVFLLNWKSHLRPLLHQAIQQALKAFEARPKGALRPGLKGLKVLIWKAAGKNVP